MGIVLCQKRIRHRTVPCPRQVNAYIYDSAYRGTESIFWQVEMATVTANTAVTEIIIHIFGD